jgi:hypothetical protein
MTFFAEFCTLLAHIAEPGSLKPYHARFFDFDTGSEKIYLKVLGRVRPQNTKKFEKVLSGDTLPVPNATVLSNATVLCNRK